MAEPSGAIAKVGVGLGSAKGASFGKEMEKRITGLDGGADGLQRARRGTMLPPAERARSAMVKPARPERRRAAGSAGSAPELAIMVSCNTTSCAVDQRCSGSLAMQVTMVRSRAGGVACAIPLIGAGSLSRIALATLSWLLPSKARLPVTIS